MTLDDDFGPASLNLLCRRLERDDYISPQELAALLEVNPQAMLRDDVRKLVLSHLRGAIKKPRGRKPAGLLTDLRNDLIPPYYERRRRWLQQRKARYGHTCCWLRDTRWQDAPVHQQAALLAAHALRHLGPPVHSLTILNIVSSRKNRAT